MRILLTNHQLKLFAGTEVWTYYMASELVKMGHEVVVWSPSIGRMADIIDGIPGVEVCTFLPRDERFELIISNHNICQECVVSMPGIKVFMCHGPHALEKPRPGGTYYATVSMEQMVVTLAQDYIPPDKRILFTNCVPKVELSPRRPTPKHILSLCKGPDARTMVEGIARRLDCDYDYAHARDNPVWPIRPLIKEADIVFSYGLGAIDALAQGKCVFVYDSRGPNWGDGIVRCGNFHALQVFNFSGRATRKAWNSDEIVREIEDHYEGSTEGMELPRSLLRLDTWLPQFISRVLS